MHYQISRNGQTYGPYTLEDLQRYLGTGNVLGTDLAKSEEMPEWLPVAQLLAAATIPNPAAAQPNPAVYPQQAFANPAYSPVPANPVLANSPYPDAPNLHWGLVVLFSVLTCFFLFTFIWDIVIAVWLRRVQPDDRSLLWYFGALGVYVVQWVASIFLVGYIASHQVTSESFANSQFLGYAGVSKLLSLVTLGIIIAGNFVKRASLERHFNGPEPVGLTLDPVMTFFFAPWYFQYHLNRINAMKAAARGMVPRAF